MKITILQLSDIHISGSGDVAHRYLPEIASIFNEVSFPKVEKVIVAVCGDIAFSGTTAQYKAAEQTFRKLRGNIVRILNIEPDFIALPGNHDCDFSLNDAVRDLLIQSIPTGNTKLSEKSVIDQCIKVQQPFWKFADLPLFHRPQTDHNKIYLEHRFELDTKRIRFRCYNTAWVSQEHEEPGRMALPRKHFQGHDSELALDLSVSMLHHPTKIGSRRIASENLMLSLIIVPI